MKPIQLITGMVGDLARQSWQDTFALLRVMLPKPMYTGRLPAARKRFRVLWRLVLHALGGLQLAEANHLGSPWPVRWAGQQGRAPAIGGWDIAVVLHSDKDHLSVTTACCNTFCSLCLGSLPWLQWKDMDIIAVMLLIVNKSSGYLMTSFLEVCNSDAIQRWHA